MFYMLLVTKYTFAIKYKQIYTWSKKLFADCFFEMWSGKKIANCLFKIWVRENNREIFDLYFFHDSNPSRPLINRLKCFRIWFPFCQDILIFKKLRSVHPIAESDSAVCITPWSHENQVSKKTPRCASHCGVRLCGVHHTT